ncbi:MAG: hypothetical protein IIB02_08305 [Thaumarchaeota archaeon]|nr:hypothetical protein [Nitrososphaerota archaeon]
MTVPLTNCKKCMKYLHDECTRPKTCLCAVETKHNAATLRDGVKVDFDKPIDENYNEDVKSVNDSIKQEPKSYRIDDWYIVAILIQMNDNFLTLRENLQMWYYNKDGGIYKPDADTIIAESCQRMINKCQNKTVKEIIGTIQRNKTMIDMKELFESLHINTLSGILDSKTFEVKPHSPEYYTTAKLPFKVNFQSRNLKLWNHILTIIDPKDINLIMELIWICISGSNPFKKMFVFKGLTNTQKTTLANIIVWIIGTDNVSREKPQQFLSKNTRFSSSKFIGKRMNIASEIGNLDEGMIENQKALVGGELVNTERKNDNKERYFDPEHFVFLYTTNNLGPIYSQIMDNSVIGRYQFIIFRNQLDDSMMTSEWYDKFFIDDKDKQSSIETIVNIIINYKKAQSLGRAPKTTFSTIADTKRILDEELPIEDKYFRDERIIKQKGSELLLSEIIKDFESFTGLKLGPQRMGYILKKNGILSKRSNNITKVKGYSFNTPKDEKLMEVSE